MLNSAYEKYRFLCILSYVCLNIMYGITGFFCSILDAQMHLFEIDSTWRKVIAGVEFLL